MALSKILSIKDVKTKEIFYTKLSQCSVVLFRNENENY